MCKHQLGGVAAQAAVSMLSGLRSDARDSAIGLEPRNPHSNATWPYPPTMIMRILNGEAEDVIERCNMTIEAMLMRVRACAGTACP